MARLQKIWNRLTGEECRQLTEKYDDAVDAMKKMEQEVALVGKVGRNRMRLLKKRPGQSLSFPKGMEFPNRLFISLFGETAAGKSSFVNSLNYAVEALMKGVQRVQSAAPAYTGAHTLESQEIVLTDFLSVMDNPGITSDGSKEDATQTNIIKRMEGTYRHGTVTWQSLVPAHRNAIDKKSFCSVLVFSAHNPNVVREYRSFISCLRQWQGRFPLAVITHVDEVSPRNVRLALEALGIGTFYEVANITSGREKLSPEHQLQLLQLLDKCFEDGDSIFLRRQEIDNME